MPFPTVAGLPQGATITEVIDYDIQKVDWNRYELDNGITVCFIQLPLTVFATDRTDSEAYPRRVDSFRACTRETLEAVAGGVAHAR